MGEEPEEEGEGGTEYEAGDNWKIKSGVFATMDDVAGQAAEAQWELAAKIEERTEEDKEDAENEEHAAEFAEGIHKRHSNGIGSGWRQAKRDSSAPQAGVRATRTEEKSRPASVGMTA